MNVSTAPLGNLQPQPSASMNVAAATAINIGNNQNPMQYNAANATGYPMQSIDGRSCVVQVSNFPEQVFILFI